MKKKRKIDQFEYRKKESPLGPLFGLQGSLRGPPSGDPFLTLLGAENVIITVVLRLGPFWGGALFDIVALLFYDFLKCRFRETMR